METNGYHHTLKCWPDYFEAILSGAKTFEYRKDDRDPAFQTGHYLCLDEWHPISGEYTGRSLTVLVTYITRGSVIPEGYCVMGIK